MEKIELMDDEGNKVEFNILDTFGMDDEDYAVLEPVNEEDDMVYILRIENSEDDGEVVLVGIDDEEELNDAISVYEELKEKKNN